MQTKSICYIPELAGRSSTGLVGSGSCTWSSWRSSFVCSVGFSFAIWVSFDKVSFVVSFDSNLSATFSTSSSSFSFSCFIEFVMTFWVNSESKIEKSKRENKFDYSISLKWMKLSKKVFSNKFKTKNIIWREKKKEKNEWKLFSYKLLENLE